MLNLKNQGIKVRVLKSNPFFVVLSTNKENDDPKYIKLTTVPKDDSSITEQFLLNSITVDSEKILNTDGSTTFNVLKDKMTVNNKKVDYKEDDHRLYWLNIVISSIKNNITGIYRGISKRDMPLFMSEQEYRFNHRLSGTTLMNNVFRYISNSKPITKRSIIAQLDFDYYMATA